MDYLTDSDIKTVSRNSSINQYDGFIGAMNNGMFCPIVFDFMDGIVCGKVHSHKIMIHFGNWIGYHYPVKKCKYTKRTYVIGENTGEKLEILPMWFGRGDCWHNNFYESKYNNKGPIRGDNGAFVGFEDKQELNIGLDYINADDTLEAID